MMQIITGAIIKANAIMNNYFGKNEIACVYRQIEGRLYEYYNDANEKNIINSTRKLEKNL